ncbi:hypothetical protein J6S46_03110, partial [Candidatus Saccharibacteria bacterium]|nr:hypothetical protein [Candidatus Saccharibacteria bacterium]
EEELVNKLLTAYAAGDLKQVSEILKNLFNANVKAETIAEELINAILNNPAPSYLKLLDGLTTVKSPFAEAKLLVALTTLVAAPIAALPTAPAPTPAPSKIPTPKVTPLATPKPAAPASETPIAKAPTTKPSDFNWETFVETVEAKNNAISAQLKKAEHKFDGSSLHIYPIKRIIKTIIERPNNRAIIIEALNGIKLEIHDVDERLNQNENSLVNKISDIMGGAEEVEKNGGKIPF